MANVQDLMGKLLALPKPGGGIPNGKLPSSDFQVERGKLLALPQYGVNPPRANFQTQKSKRATSPTLGGLGGVNVANGFGDNHI